MDVLTSISDISPKIHVTKHSPRFSDGDPAGIVYFANYPMFFDESFIDIAKQHGFDWSSRDVKFIIPIVEQKATYKAPITVGTDYHIATAIIHKGNRSFRTGHVLFFKRGDKFQVSAFGYISRAVVNPQKFEAMKMPEELGSALEEYLISESEWEELQNLFLSK